MKLLYNETDQWRCNLNLFAHIFERLTIIFIPIDFSQPNLENGSVNILWDKKINIKVT